MPRQRGKSATYLEDKSGQKATRYCHWWKAKFSIFNFLRGLGINFYASLGHDKEFSTDPAKVSKVTWSRMMVNAPIRVMWEDSHAGMKVAQHVVGQAQFRQLRKAVSETLLTLGLNPKEFNLPPTTMTDLYPQGEELKLFKKGKVQVKAVPVSDLHWVQALVTDGGLHREVGEVRDTFDVRTMKNEYLEAVKKKDANSQEAVLFRLSKMEEEVRKVVATYVKKHRPTSWVGATEDKSKTVTRNALVGVGKYVEGMREDLDKLTAQRRAAEDEIRRIDKEISARELEISTKVSRRRELRTENEKRTELIDKLNQMLSIGDPSHESGAVLRVIENETAEDLNDLLDEAGA